MYNMTGGITTAVQCSSDCFTMAKSPVKIMLIGDAEVGKSSLAQSLVYKEFSSSTLATIGIDYYKYRMDIDGNSVQIQIWDTAGQERFATVMRSYYASAHGIVVVYDVTRPATYLHVEDWVRKLKENDSDVVKILVGNKVDLPNRCITTLQGVEIARENDIEYFETSAKTRENVESAFKAIVTSVVNTFHTDKPCQTTDDNGIVIVQREPLRPKAVQNKKCSSC